MVFDPVLPASHTSDLDNFGHGCGQYLHFYAAGQPEFGKTNFIESRSWMVGLNYKDNLMLTPEEAPAATVIQGTTHVAVGDMKVEGDKLTLTYKLLSEPDGKAVGEPIVVSGNQEQIAKSLPDIARRLAVSLGVKNPAVPGRMNLTASELTSIASDFRYELCAPAEAIALKDPYAAIYAAFNGEIRSMTLEAKILRTALEAAPTNTMLWASMLGAHPRYVTNLISKYDDLRKKYPKNSLLAMAQVDWDHFKEKYEDEVGPATRAVAAAPNSESTHMSRRNALYDATDSLRQGRYWADIEPEVAAKLGPMYAEIRKECEWATKLNPNDGEAWAKLCQAQTFLGDTDAAHTSLAKAIELDGDHHEVIHEGLMLNNKKWGGTDEAYEAYCVELISDHKLIGDDAIMVAGSLADHPAAAQSVMTRETQRMEKYAQEHSKDPYALRGLANMYFQNGNRTGALKTLDSALALDSRNGWILARATWIAYVAGLEDQALKYGLASMNVDPDSAEPMGVTAFEMFRKGRKDEAYKLAQATLKLDPANPQAKDLLFEKYFAKGDWQGAFAVIGNVKTPRDKDMWERLLVDARNYNPLKYLHTATVAIHLFPEWDYCWICYAYAYGLNGKFKEQLDAARQALKHFPNDIGLIDYLAEGYEKTGDSVNALKEYHHALELMPGDFNFAQQEQWTKMIQDALRRMGDKSQPPIQHP